MCLDAKQNFASHESTLFREAYLCFNQNRKARETRKHTEKTKIIEVAQRATRGSGWAHHLPCPHAKKVTLAGAPQKINIG